MIALAELMDEKLENEMKDITTKVIAPWPNTYVYSKSITEEVVRLYGEILPISIVRPSISKSKSHLLNLNQNKGVLIKSIIYSCVDQRRTPAWLVRQHLRIKWNGCWSSSGHNSNYVY